MDKISVIVPVYNVESQLSRCIESILNQSYKNLELILVDDGSSDKSGDICDKFAKNDDRIKVYHIPNGGVSSARNFGIDNSSGKWICFVDSDDSVCHTYIEDFGISDFDTDLYMQGYKKIKDGVIVETRDFADCTALSFINIIAYSEDNCIINSPCFKLFKRSIIVNNNIRFDHRTSYGEDHLFALDYVKFAKTVNFSLKSGYNYYISNECSLTQRIVPYQEISYYSIAARKKQMDLLDQYLSLEYKISIDRVLVNNYIRTLRYLFKSDVKIEYFKWVQKVFRRELHQTTSTFLSFKHKLIRIFSIYGFDSALYIMLKMIWRRC